MITFQQVYDKFQAALTLRPIGTRVQAEDLEDANLLLLAYLDQEVAAVTGSVMREAHASSTAGSNCNLTWNNAFPDTDYSFLINGYDAQGGQVEIIKISKSSTKVVVKTYVNAELYAIARPYSGSTS